MAVPLSKITPPSLPKSINRSRLSEFFANSLEKRLILVLGQAAQGKTTVAASWVRELDIPYAWVYLDADESDPVNLFYLLVHSVQHAVKGVDFSALFNYAGTMAGPREEMALYRDWVKRLLGLIPSSLYIILDGLDRLSSDAPSFRLLQVLIEQASPGIRLIMLSRTSPPLEIHRLEMDREATVLTNDELAFTPREVRSFFKETLGINLKADQLRRIHDLTEGWIGGLILLSQALSRLPEGAREKYISEGLSHDFRTGVFRYLGEQIFASLPAGTREFLVRSSALEMIEPDFVADWLGIKNAAEILTDLMARSLFVQSIHEGTKGWIFRFHQLFREFLQARFELEVKIEEKRNLLEKAGCLFEKKGQLEASLDCYLRAQAFGETGRVLEKLGLDLLRVGRTRDLSRWLMALPQEIILENPWLLYYKAMSRRFTMMKENSSILWTAFSRFKEQGVLSGALLALASLIEVSVFGDNRLVPLPALLEEGEALLMSVDSDQFPYERAVLWFQTGFAQSLRNGNPRKGYCACHKAYLLARGLGDIPLQVSALIHALGALSFLGEFSLAEETNEKIEKMLAEVPHPELRAMHLVHSIQLSICKGDLEQAKELIRVVRSEVEEYGLIYVFPGVLLYDLMSKPYLKAYDEGEAVGNQLLDMALSAGNLFIHGVGLMFLGVNAYHKEDFKTAEELLERSRAGLSSEEIRSEWHLCLIPIPATLIAYHLGNDWRAEISLCKSLEHFKQIGSHTYVMEAHFAMALMRWRQGRVSEAVQNLSVAFGIAETKGYEHCMFLNKNDLVKACALALELEIEGAVNYAARLLTVRLASHSESELHRLSNHVKPEVRKSAIEVRRSIHRSKVPRIRLEALGGFRVFNGNGVIEESRWKGSQPKLLLKAIIARGCRWVPRDILMEDLWPSAEYSQVTKSLEINLHRLRNALEPEMNRDFGSSYVHLKSNLISLDDELCSVDVQEFLSNCQEGDSASTAGEVKEAMVSYEKAVELYKGDFLPEDPYISWADLKRDQLRTKYVDTLYRMAQLHENSAAYTKAVACYSRIIETDPLSEHAYQRLMTIHSGRGKRNEAIRVYELCKKALQSELDTEPDPLTESIFKKILESR